MGQDQLIRRFCKPQQMRWLEEVRAEIPAAGYAIPGAIVQLAGARRRAGGATRIQPLPGSQGLELVGWSASFVSMERQHLASP